MGSNLKRSIRVDGFVLASCRNDRTGLACLLITQHGKVVFRRTNDNGGEYYIGQHPTQDPDLPSDAPDIADGADITGLAHPEVVVYSYSGGAHCCWETWVFELQPNLHRVATLDAEDSPAYFADLEHNGHYFYLADDWTFAYWPSSFAGSPVAPIVLRFIPDGKGGCDYHLALDKMNKPAPTRADWNKALEEARATFSDGAWQLDANLWNTVMNLIYSGHSDLAWNFVDEAWPARVPGKKKWIGDFCSRLKTSPFWADLEPNLREMPPACRAAKPDQSK